MPRKRLNTRDDFIDYCLRRLGHPVIEINIDDQQIEDRVDDALQIFQDYVAEGSFRAYIPVTITQTMIDNAKIDFDTDVTFTTINAENIIQVVKVLPFDDSGSSTNFFDIKYQMRLNDFFQLEQTVGDLAYYEQMQQYIGLIDMKLVGTPQIQFSRNGNTLQIWGDLVNYGDLKVGKTIAIEMYVAADPDETGNRLWDNQFLKEYATALIKRQWGENLSKFEGMQLPGGVTINGRQIIEDANQEIEVARQRIYNEYDTPPDFFMG